MSRDLVQEEGQRHAHVESPSYRRIPLFLHEIAHKALKKLLYADNALFWRRVDHHLLKLSQHPLRQAAHDVTFSMNKHPSSSK